MTRAIPILAVLSTGLALGILAAAIALSGRSSQRVVDDIPLLDPIAATPEIADVRESRGSILAGTSLAASEDPAEFSAALANLTGAELPAAAVRESPVVQLRHRAHEFEDHAQRYELQERYEEADELRRLSEETRRVARMLAKEEQSQASLPAAVERR